MTEEQIALARRAIACKGWRWMPGMRCLVGPLHAPYRYVTHDYAPPEGNDVAFTDPFLPDLQDPATRGCVLELVREAHACLFLQVSVSISREHGYRFECSPHHRGKWVDTEEEALVAALEAAP